MKHRHSPDQSGVALVTTMIVVAVLAVVAVAFMQSTSTDRLSSRSGKNYMQARLAAEAGAAAAEALVADLVRRYPDSATVWQNIGSGTVAGTNNEATVMYVRAQSANTNLGASPGQSGGAVSLLAHPLVSGASLVTLGSAVGTMVYAATDTNMVNLNATNSTRPRPFIGRRSMTNAGAPVAAARWIYLTNSAGQTNARYAFWIEDESFKVNVNLATNGPRGADSLGLSSAEARLDGAWGSATGSPLGQTDAGAVVSARRSLPGSNFPTALTTALPANLTDQEATDELKFLTTVNSAGLDLSRGGFKRVNINSLTNGITGPSDSVNIRSNLNRIIAAITNTNAVPLFGQRFYRQTNATLTTINQTNYVTNSTAVPHAGIYLQKIAANLLDYLDNNDQPTVINNDAGFTIRTGRPEYGIEPLGGGLDGTNSVASVGVEAVPRLQEYAIHARIRSMRHDPNDANSFGFVYNADGENPTSAQFEIWIDHYFEFYNPSTKDIRLTNAFIKIYDQPAFGPGVSGALSEVDRETTAIPLPANNLFRAGRTTIVTTTPSGPEFNGGPNVSSNALVDTAKMLSSSDIIYLNAPPANRKFTGTTTAITNYVYNSEGGPAPSTFGTNAVPYDKLFYVDLVPRSTSVTDYRSAMVLGNTDGILESHLGLPIAIDSTTDKALSLCVRNGYIRDGLGSGTTGLGPGNNDNVRGGSIRGNATNAIGPSSAEGDPRALVEQLTFTNYVAGLTNVDQTRFYVTTGDGGQEDKLPAGTSMGLPQGGNTAPYTNWVDPAKWADCSSLGAGNSNAPLVVRNASMQSIGELGHITDPARVPGPGGILLARGGGRTLRVGQPELGMWYDKSQNRPSRTWTSWRLADIFTTTAASNNATAANPQGILTNALGVVRGGTNTNGAVVTIPGLINPNGALRDNGAAMRAALFDLTFVPTTGGAGALGLAGQKANVTNVVTNLVRRLTTLAGTDLPANSLNAFWERGEISELNLLNAGTALAGGVNMSNVFDRGREELVRRSIEMLTPRGSVFTVYAIGQTLQGTNVTGTAHLKQTFEVQPQFANPSVAFDDAFDASALGDRFRAPTNYTVRVLATSYD